MDYVWAGPHMLPVTGQRKNCGIQLYAFTMWVPGIKTLVVRALSQLISLVLKARVNCSA